MVISSSPVNSECATSSDEGVGVTGNVSSSTDELRLRRKSTYKVPHSNDKNSEVKQLRSLINDLHSKELEYQRKLAQMDIELRNMRNEYEVQFSTRAQLEKVMRVVEEELKDSNARAEEMRSRLRTRDQECAALKMDVDTLNEDNRRLKEDLHVLNLKVRL